MSNELSKYQKQVDDLIAETGGYWQPLAQFTRLTEEVGELARLLNHLYGDKPKKPTEARQELDQEIGDVLFTLICLANQEGINLDKALDKAMTKLQTRDKNRYTKQP